MTKPKKPASRGNTIQFDELHGQLTAAYVAALKNFKKAGATPPPQFLSALQRFLAENGVTVPARSSRFDPLKGQLPNMDELEAASNVVPISRTK